MFIEPGAFSSDLMVAHIAESVPAFVPVGIYDVNGELPVGARLQYTPTTMFFKEGRAVFTVLGTNYEEAQSVIRDIVRRGADILNASIEERMKMDVHARVENFIHARSRRYYGDVARNRKYF